MNTYLITHTHVYGTSTTVFTSETPDLDNHELMNRLDVLDQILESLHIDFEPWKGEELTITWIRLDDLPVVKIDLK